MFVFGVVDVVFGRGVAADGSSSDEDFLRVGVLFGLGVAVSSASAAGLRLLGVLFATGFASSSSAIFFLTGELFGFGLAASSASDFGFGRGVAPFLGRGVASSSLSALDLLESDLGAATAA